MRHLNTEELLLVAEGEGAAEALAHLEGCAACRAGLGELQGTLTAATTALRARVEDESPAGRDEAWARLAPALRPEAHLDLRELLLYCEDELPGLRTAHLEHCAECHDESLRAQAFLAEVEHDLRATVESEPAARRAAALAALEAHMRPAAANVIEFPLRWATPYAAAAAIAFAAAGGYLFTLTQTPAPNAQTAVATVEPAPETAPVPAAAPEAAAAAVSTATPAIQQTTVAMPSPQPAARFELAAGPSEGVRPASVSTEQAPGVEPAETARLEPAWNLAVPAAPVERNVEVVTSAPSPRATETLIVGDRVVGGLVRTALVEHYEDAARRSFQTPQLSAIEGELARFVTSVYRDQSELLKHAYELSRLTASDTADRAAVQSHLRRAAARERAIYDSLSETLPRRFWTAGGRTAVEPAGDAAAEAKALLADAIALEETLTSMFNRSTDSFDVRENVSSGRLLERIEARLKNLRAALRSL